MDISKEEELLSVTNKYKWTSIVRLYNANKISLLFFDAVKNNTGMHKSQFLLLFNPFKTNFSLTFSKKTEYIFLSYVSIEELFRK